MSKSITHTGTIVAVDKGMIRVRLDKETAECSGCVISSLCSQPETLDIPADNISGKDLVGQKVVLDAYSSSQAAATILMLVIPVILLVGGLAVILYLGCSETTAIISASAVTALWYLLIWTQRSRLRQKTGFRIRPQ